MNVRTASLAAAVALALASLLALVLTAWPVSTPPPAQRADLRPQLARRHAQAQSSAVATEVTDVAVPSTPLDALLLCEQPGAGRVNLLPGPVHGELRLIVPCHGGLDVWSLADAAPRRLLRLELGGASLEPGVAEGLDLDDDGAWDLLLSLVAEGSEAAHQQGLYWLRGRRAGGFEAPVRLWPAAVDALAVAASEGGGDTGALWVAVHEPAPARRSLLWRVPRGPAPEREGQWPLPAPATALAFVPAQPPSAEIWTLAGGELLRKPSQDPEAPPAALAGASGLRDLWVLPPDAFVASPEGVRALTRATDGALGLGPARGPVGADDLAVAPGGVRVALVDGALWSWGDAGEPTVLEGVGGARVEALLARDERVWLWLSGLSGVQATGLARLPSPWPPPAGLELAVRRVPEGGEVAALRLP